MAMFEFSSRVLAFLRDAARIINSNSEVEDGLLLWQVNILRDWHDCAGEFNPMAATIYDRRVMSIRSRAGGNFWVLRVPKREHFREIETPRRKRLPDDLVALLVQGERGALRRQVRHRPVEVVSNPEPGPKSPDPDPEPTPERSTIRDYGSMPHAGARRNGMDPWDVLLLVEIHNLMTGLKRRILNGLEIAMLFRRDGIPLQEALSCAERLCRNFDIITARKMMRKERGLLPGSNVRVYALPRLNVMGLPFIDNVVARSTRALTELHRATFPDFHQPESKEEKGPEIPGPAPTPTPPSNNGLLPSRRHTYILEALWAAQEIVGDRPLTAREVKAVQLLVCPHRPDILADLKKRGYIAMPGAERGRNVTRRIVSPPPEQIEYKREVLSFLRRPDRWKIRQTLERVR